jgi:3-hydroxymyristoyl/3-hydroxydecanoyl-(acyl carrier protein) dehydratase
VSETFEIGSTHPLGEGRVRIEVRVPLRSVYFEGHFEGRPMLPGVAQVVGLAEEQAARVFSSLGPARRLMRTKFQAVVAPGDRLALFLDREPSEGETKVRFRLERADESVSSGVLVFGLA